jgi:hypothetical protein
VKALAGRTPRGRAAHAVARPGDASPGLDLFVLGLVWLGMVLLVDPIGNFPLNDDWSYGRSVELLVGGRGFHLTDFTAVPLVAQVAWGALFSLPAGFSFTGLRISTLVLGLVGVLATYGLLRESRAGRTVALIGALLVATNPLYVVLAFTFMTDVPFFAVSVLALLFLVRGVLRNRQRELRLSFLFTALALLIRQPAIIIPIAFAVAYPIARGLRRRVVLQSLVAVGGGLIVLIGYQIALKLTIGVPPLYNRTFDPLTETASGFSQLVAHFFDRLFNASLYLGLFLLPLTVVITISGWKSVPLQRRRLSLVATTALVGTVTAGLAWANRLMPSVGNVFFDLGLGPPLLRDTYLLGLPHLPRAPRAVWVAMTAAGVTGAALLVRALWWSGRDVARAWRGKAWKERSFPWALALTACALYLISIMAGGYIDRYLLFALPLLMITLGRPAASSRLKAGPVAASAGMVLVGLYGLFSVAATHDYLSWNRARWAALDRLTDANVSYLDIDGGFEFNGRYAYSSRGGPISDKSLWPVERKKYLLSFGPVTGYEIFARYPYERWMPWETGQVFVLRRLDARNDTSARSGGSAGVMPGAQNNRAGDARAQGLVKPGSGPARPSPSAATGGAS